MFRANEADPIIIDEFEGVNRTVDEVELPPGFVRNSMGGFFNNEHNFERLPGKRLNTSNSTTRGRVLTIASMEFRDRTVVLFHSSNAYDTEIDLSLLATTNTSINSLLPFIT